MNQSAFDLAAKSYDKDFTKSGIGSIQREQVWTYLSKLIKDKKGLKILEINCGTGEDAIRLAQLDHEVKATDISTEMIKICKDKRTNLPNLHFEQMDINDLGEENSTYDLVFSNFGGLNCLSPVELKNFFDVLPKVMNKKGQFISVVMPKFCLIESIYYLLKLNIKKAFRRMSMDSSHAESISNKLEVYYYNPKDFKNGLNSNFHLITHRGIGITTPPSYLEPFTSRHPSLLKLTKNADELLNKIKLTSYISDHYLIDFELKS